MSRKTKAELEAENKLLKRQVEIQSEQIRDLLDGAEWDQYKLKTTNDAHDATIKQAYTLSDTAHVQAHDVKSLVDKNKNRGGSSYQCYQPVHRLAERYFRLKRRRDPEYFPGKAAREVREHCLDHHDRYKHVPAQKTIKAKLLNTPT